MAIAVAVVTTTAMVARNPSRIHDDAERRRVKSRNVLDIAVSRLGRCKGAVLCDDGGRL